MHAKESGIVCSHPNKFARSPKIELRDDSCIFHGYQEFVLRRDSIWVLTEDQTLQKKKELLSPYFTPRYLSHRTVLDLGANAGFFCFWALQTGARKVIALDMDEEYLRMIEKARDKLGFSSLELVSTNVIDCEKPTEVVFALALVHWIYSCTTVFGSLDSTLQKLAQLTEYMLIVEWVDPADPAINFFGHLNWNKDLIREAYTLEAFESGLAHHFARYQLIGNVSPTRRLYAAFRTMNEIDLSGSLPFIMPQESVICSRRLVNKNGIEYWSRLYHGGDVIYKQVSLDLAEREAHFLSQLQSDYFPKVHQVRSKECYSVLTLENIHGLPLQRAVPRIHSSPAELHAFIEHCLNILRELKDKDITHRDIRPDNILVRDKKPVLIDFGWAISPAQPYFTPEALGSVERPPDGSFCDVYSMGRVFDQINQHRYPAFDLAIEMMSEADPSLRITDLQILKILFASTIASAAYDME